METRKLSEVLAELQQKQGEANDKIIMSRDGKTYSMGATQMYPASENNSGVMTAEHVAQLVGLTDRLNGIVGEEQQVFLEELDNWGDKYFVIKQGWFAIVQSKGAKSSPIGHMLVTTDPMKHVCYQLVFGNFTIDNNTLSTSHTDGQFRILIRYYSVFNTDTSKIGTWSDWRVFFEEVPTVQTSVNGTNKNYVYSKVGTQQNEVLSGTFKVYQYNGKIRVTHKLWGSTTDYADGMYHSADFPTVNSSSDGAMDHNVHARILNHTLTEGNSTTNSVLVNYTNFSASGNKTLTLTAASSAKAGVMTVDHVQKLDGAIVMVNDLRKASTETNERISNIENHYRYLGNFTTETDALNKLTELDVCANAELLHAHLTYTDAAYADSTIILVQSIHGALCRQVVFNKDKIFQRCIYFTDENRTAISWKEDWNYLFCDRLSWNASERKYIPNQFGAQFNSEYTDQIPLASDSVDGLMSKEDKALLEKIKKQLNL